MTAWIGLTYIVEAVGVMGIVAALVWWFLLVTHE